MNRTSYISSSCHITERAILLDGNILFKNTSSDFTAFMKSAYKHFEIDYPKFFKMDRLSKLAFLAAEVLLGHPNTFKAMPADGHENQNMAVILSNRASSLDTDRKYQESISDLHNFYPSPAVFVYTLPNICIGEISIRHKLRSENSFFIFDAFNPGCLRDYSESLLQTDKADEVLCGWVDVDNDSYGAFLYLVSPTGSRSHTEQELTKLYSTP
ncbi:MAG: 3-oxoacyl-ACP synthase [Pricia sp.]